MAVFVLILRQRLILYTVRDINHLITHTEQKTEVSQISYKKLSLVVQVNGNIKSSLQPNDNAIKNVKILRTFFYLLLVMDSYIWEIARHLKYPIKISYLNLNKTRTNVLQV